MTNDAPWSEMPICKCHPSVTRYSACAAQLMTTQPGAEAKTASIHLVVVSLCATHIGDG